MNAHKIKRLTTISVASLLKNSTYPICLHLPIMLKFQMQQNFITERTYVYERFNFRKSD